MPWRCSPLPRRRLLVAPVAVVAGLALVAGCGGSTSHATTSTTAAGPPTTPAPADDLQLRAVVVQPNDLPAGWVAQPTNSQNTGPPLISDYASCLGITDTSADKASTGVSPDFNSSNAIISSGATSFRSDASVTTDVAGLHSPKIGSCLQQELENDGLLDPPPGGTRGAVTLSVNGPSTGSPAGVVAVAHATAAFTVQGKPTSLVLDDVFLTGKRIEAQILFVGVTAAVPETTQSQVVGKVAARLAQVE